MNQTLSPILQPEHLSALAKNKTIVIIDAGPSRERYEKEHLDGALYVDLNTDLANVPQDAAHGGRHPLPTPEQFGKVLGRLGISAESHVIVYDDKNGSNAAARFWWMLRAAGHTKVQLLNGGMQAAVKTGFPVSNKIPVDELVENYNFSHWLLPTADMAEVERSAPDYHHLVIDVRDKERFNGITEPIDLVAGHIPGTVNIPFETNLDSNGLFLPPDILKEKYTEVLGNISPENVTVHCGSGVTACHTLLAMDYAGLQIAKLYVGSWSEWSRNDKNIGRGIM